VQPDENRHRWFYACKKTTDLSLTTLSVCCVKHHYDGHSVRFLVDMPEKFKQAHENRPQLGVSLCNRVARRRAGRAQFQSEAGLLVFPVPLALERDRLGAIAHTHPAAQWP
jgi:hypothetical protein